MMTLFFSKEGKHIVCGGTTSSLAAKYLNKPLKTQFDCENSNLPPIGEIDGTDLVTEGILTINTVLKYAQSYLKDNKFYADWSEKKRWSSTNFKTFI